MVKREKRLFSLALKRKYSAEKSIHFRQFSKEKRSLKSPPLLLLLWYCLLCCLVMFCSIHLDCKQLHVGVTTDRAVLSVGSL